MQWYRQLIKNVSPLQLPSHHGCYMMTKLGWGDDKCPAPMFKYGGIIYLFFLVYQWVPPKIIFLVKIKRTIFCHSYKNSVFCFLIQVIYINKIFWLSLIRSSWQRTKWSSLYMLLRKHNFSVFPEGCFCIISGTEITARNHAKRDLFTWRNKF